MKTNFRYIYFSLVMLCMSWTTIMAQEKNDADTLHRLPYDTFKKSEQMTGSIWSVDGVDLSKRVSGDLRSRLTGMLPALEITENGGSYFSAAKTNFGSYVLGGGGYTVSMKGLGGVVAIVDDMLVPLNQLLLEPNQIESVTILSDILDKSRFGPMGTFGTVYIKTKGGGYNTPLRINASVESGVRFTDRVTEWMSGEEYAIYNNIAREASGYKPLYTEEDIAGYAKNRKYSRLTPNVDYRSLLMKNCFNTTDVNFDISSGNNIVRYSFAINGMHSGDIKKGVNDYFYDKISYSGNVNSRIGNYIEAGASFMGILGIYRDDSTSWYSYRTVPAVAFPMILTTQKDDNGDDVTVYGVSMTHGDNPYAERMEGGFLTRKSRSALFTAYLDADFSWLLKGLKSRTSLQTSSFMFSNIGMSHDYTAYYWDKEDGIGEISGHTGIKKTSRSLKSSVAAENLSMYERLSFNRDFARHNVDLGATFYLNRTFNQGASDFERYMFFVWNADWSYDKRFAVQLLAQYSGTDRFAKGARFGFFPTMGLSWTISNEDFIKNVDWIDNLKIHAQAGYAPDRNDATGNNYRYEMIYSRSSGNDAGPTSLGAATKWFGTNNRTLVNTKTTRYGNPDLTWSRLGEVDAGINLSVLGCLDFSADFFHWKLDGSIEDITSGMPAVYGFSDMAAFANYSAIATTGVIFNVNYHKTIGDFRIMANASAAHSQRINKKLVNDTYAPGNEHLAKTGKSAHAIWGLDCIGRYTDDEQILSHPSYVDASQLRVGDLMYRDVNNDGTIDSNDKVIIGDTDPELRYALTLGLEYKGFNLEVVGTGNAGADLLCNSDFFWNGWGTGNYSVFVKDEKYPNLTYSKSANNFVTSSYWLEKGGWFKIQAVDIGYTMPLKGVLKQIRFDLKGENLLTLTKVKYVDPEAPTSGLTGMPLLRVVTAGVSLTF